VSADRPSEPGPDRSEAPEPADPASGAAEIPPTDQPPDGEAASTPAARPRPSAKRRAIEWLVIVAVALVVAAVMRLFVVQSFSIPSVSMTPTLQKGDRILVNKLAYRLHGVGRGDIIVFRAPPKVASTCDTTDQDLVKRVIGLPGETISDRDGLVYINNKVLPEPWLPKNDPSTFTGTFAPVHIGANSYFVMGDNRVDSCDSRYWGTVNRSMIIGKVEVRIWPLSRIHFF
jgi:signal peptidase I